MRIPAMVVLALCTLACGEEAAPEPAHPPPSPAPEAPAEEEAPPPEPAAEAAPRPARPSDEELRAQAQADGVVVSQARTAARADNFANALSRLEPLLSRDPPGRRVHCQAGFYAYRAGDLDRAEQLLDRGLALHGAPDRVSPAMRVPLAMCLYNRGRVYEDRDDDEHAASFYRASLGLRNVAAVAERLADLGEVVVVDYAASGAGVDAHFPDRRTGADIAAVVRDMAGAVCEAASDIEANEGEQSGCSVDRGPVTVEGDGPRVEWVVFAPTAPGQPPDEYGGWDDVAYLAIVEEGSVSVIGPVARTSRDYQYPAMPAVRQAQWRDIDGQAGPELVVHLGMSTSGSEDGCHDDNTDRGTLIARKGESGWESAAAYHSSLWVAVCWGGDDEEDEETSSPSQFWEARLTFPGGGRMRLRNRQHDVTFTLAEVFAEGGVDFDALVADSEGD